MLNENPNRFRISSNFKGHKIGIYCMMAILALVVFQKLFQEESGPNEIVGSLIILGVFGGILYYMKTRPIFEYDDIKKVLYILDHKRETEIEVPVERIDKILYSSMNFLKGTNSWVIIYRDFHNQKQKVRLFPIAFQDDIKQLIADTKERNPEVKTRNWSIGVNELFD